MTITGTMEREILDFLEKLKEKKNISGNTENSYRRDLTAMSIYLEGLEIKDVNEVTREHLEEYITWMVSEGKKPSTVSRSIASMHSFFDFLFHDKLIDKDPSYEIKAPKVIKKEPEYLTEDEMNLLLSQPDIGNSKGLRDRAMLELICSTGLRVSEAIGLKTDDLNLASSYVKVSTDNSVRILNFGQRALVAITDYLRQGREALIQGNETDVLFPNCYCGLMSRQGFWKIIKEYASRAGITREITPHTLRNYYLNNSKIRNK